MRSPGLAFIACIVESVAGVIEISALPPDDNTETDQLLHQKALQREPPCAVQISYFDGNRSAVEVRSLGIPSDGDGH